MKPSGLPAIVSEIYPANLHNEGSRCGVSIDLIVLHTMEGHLRPTLMEFACPGTGVSAHYCVGEDGTVVHCVPEDRSANHAGNAEYNHRSIGIELEGFAADARPEKQLSSLTVLVAELCLAHGIPADAAHIIGHRDVPDPRDPSKHGGIHHHTDPGENFPFARVLHDVGELIA